MCSLLTYASDTTSNNASNLLLILTIIPSIAFWGYLIWGIYLLLKDKKDAAKKKLKIAIILFCTSFVFGMIGGALEASSSSDNQESSNNKKEIVEKNSDFHIKEGYSFILTRVKSPSNTSLQASKYGQDVKNMVEEHCHVKLPTCITVGYFSVDTPNGFGTLIREGFWVFYRNGSPCHLETDAALDKVAATQNGHLLISALEMNGCGCN